MRKITKHQVAAVLEPTTNSDGTPKQQAPSPAPAPSPDQSWTKATIVDWLDANGIDHADAQTKADLLALVP